MSARTDVTFYYDWTKLTLEGQVAGSSEAFPLCYGPLFLYITALPVVIWDSPKAIILFMILIELLSMPLWLSVGRKLFNEQIVRVGVILYAFCPLSIITVAITANNDVLLSFFLALALWFLLQKKDSLSGTTLGISIVACKFLSLLQMPILLVRAKKPVTWAATFLMVPVSIYGIWVLIGINPFRGMVYHAHHLSSGNLPFLLTIAGIDISDQVTRNVYNILGFLVLTIVFLSPLLRKRRYSNEEIMPLIALVLLTMMIFSAKSFTHYLLIGLIPLFFTMAARKIGILTYILYVLLGFFASTESALWFQWLHQEHLSILWANEMPTRIDYTRVVLFLLIEIGLIAVYVTLSIICLRATLRKG